MKINFKQKVWIDMGIILVSIALASGAFYYFSKDLTLQADKVINDRAAINSEDDAVEELATLKNDQPAAALYTAAINKLLPDQYGLVDFQPWLSRIGSKYNVTVTEMLQGGVSSSTASMPGTIQFSMNAQGPSGSIANFLKDIESQSTGFLFTFTSFDFTSGTGGGEIFNAQGILFFR